MSKQMNLREFCKRHLSRHLWSGTLVVDGGYGPPEIRDWLTRAADGAIHGSMDEPFFCATVSDPVEDASGEISALANPRYQAAFPGEHYTVFLEKVLHIAARCEEGQLWVMKSYLEGREPAYGEDVYRLVASSSKGSPPRLRVVKGRWIPAFDRPLPVAEISLGGNTRK